MLHFEFKGKQESKGLLKLKMISFNCNKTHAKLIREKWHLELRAESWAIKILLLLQLRQPMANWLSKFSCKKIAKYGKKLISLSNKDCKQLIHSTVGCHRNMPNFPTFWCT